MRFRKKRHDDLDARVEAAETERRRSRRRLANMRETVTGPLQETGRRNQFYEMLRDSLREGYGR